NAVSSKDRRGGPRLSLVRPRHGAAHLVAGGDAGLRDLAARWAWARLDVRAGGGISGRLDRARLPPDRRPAARQAGADRRRHRRLCHPGQSDRLAHRAGVVALPALGRPVRAHMKGRSMLVLDRVGKTYPNGVRALDGLSLAVAPGEILVTIGGSGCGKSTMLRAISGLDTPTQGKVVLDGTVISAPHEKIGIVFQEPRLLPW